MRLLDEQAEYAPALRPVVDLPDLFLGQPDGDELGELLIVPDDPERPVSGVYQFDCRLNDPPQKSVKFEA
jgi:hypothetical protein